MGRFLKESTIYAKIVKPYLENIKPLKILHQEHLEKAFNYVENNTRGPQSIAEFMAIDIDIEIQALQSDIGKWFIKYRKLSWKSMTIVLYDLIKKRCTFKDLITILTQNCMDSPDSPVEMLFTQQFLL